MDHTDDGTLLVTENSRGCAAGTGGRHRLLADEPVSAGGIGVAYDSKLHLLRRETIKACQASERGKSRFDLKRWRHSLPEAMRRWLFAI
jgi:hypothetical protein